MKKYFKILFATSLFSAMFFCVASSAFAASSVVGDGSTTTPQPFGMTCDPYAGTPPLIFIEGEAYIPTQGGVCIFAIPQSETWKFMAIYKGTVGSSTLTNFGYVNNDPDQVFDMPDSAFAAFDPQPGEEFFSVSVGGSSFSDIEDADTYFRTGVGSAPSDYSIVHWYWGAPPCSENCNDNVMFLPGIEGSYLYDSSNTEVWLPSNDSVADTLALDTTGSSTNSDITTFDAIGQTGSAQLDHDVYKDFLAKMNTWQTTYGIIATTTPYDWRLDYNTLLTNGKKLSDGHITYLQPPLPGQDPYIIATLKQLANSSPTGKVTIIAHSNGGLLAKALMQKLGATTTAQLIGKVILVDVPQVGTPQAVGALLNGYHAGIPNATSDAEARKLAQNMPAAYNLLPSNGYFTYTDNPVITFDDASMSDWLAQYSDSSNPAVGIHSVELLQNFMTDNSGFRPTPAFDDTDTPAIVNSQLYSNSTTTHASLDLWTPPAGVQLITIAGWGNETLSGINFKREANGCLVSGTNGCAVSSYGSQITYDPLTVIDGDGTVVDSSQQWAGGASSTRYWVNLYGYNCPTFFTCLPQTGLVAAEFRVTHSNILEVSELQNLLTNIISNSSTTTLPEYISTTEPTYDGSEPRLHFVLHSPLTLGFTDSSGNYTGSTATTTVFNSHGVDYERFGEMQWLSVPASMTGQVVMDGTASGSFALDVQSVNGDTVEATTTFAAVPVATSTIATLAVSPSVSPTASSTLDVDENGDGTTDLSMPATQGAVVTPPFATISQSIPTTTVHQLFLISWTATSTSACTVTRQRLSDGVTNSPWPDPVTGTELTGSAYAAPSSVITVHWFIVCTGPNGTVQSDIYHGSVSTAVTVSSISGGTINLGYTDLPTNAQLVYVEASTSQTVAGYRVPLGAGGTASTTLFANGIAPGTYYLLAQDATTSAFIIQSDPFTIGTSSSPTVTYDSASSTAQTVSFEYANLPTNSQIVFVNNTSGQATTTDSFLVAAGGTGSTTVSTAGITTYGGYHLKAQDDTDGTYYAQTVTFYISAP